LHQMLRLKAHVRNGRIVADDPTDLPEGKELILEVVEEDEDLKDEALLRVLRASVADAKARRLIDADQLLDELDKT
jgi:hypothetical protein